VSSAAVSPRAAGGETALAVLYFAAYLGYLFVHQEGELLHWLTLVLVPLAGIALVGRYPSAGALVGSIGLDAVTAARGLPLAALLGIAFQGLQLLNARQRADLMEALEAPFGFVLPLVAFALLVGTVATTEEVFFRGILQRRLAETLRSESAALGLATVAFALYHVPYAYLKPSWPSAGDAAAALRLAAANGVIGGLALGLVYWRSHHNLIAAIGLHACIDLIPATRLVHGLFTPTS
jgi:membrane protease YdiL (CAAX protease family)